VVHLSESIDFIDITKRKLRSHHAAQKADEFKKEGNLFYNQHSYEQAIDCYTKACYEK